MTFYGRHITYEDKDCWLTNHWKAIGRTFFVLGILGVAVFGVFSIYPGMMPSFLADLGMAVIVNLGEICLAIGFLMWLLHKLDS